MPARTKDMTRGNPTRLILTFCLPIVAGNLFQQLYSLVDTLVIGQVEGVTALAAVSAAGWLDWLVLGLAMGLAQGFSIQVAQCFGAADYTGLRRAVGQSLLLSAGVVVLLTILSQSLLYPALVLLRSPANTIDLTCEYLRIIFSGITLVMGFNLLSGILRSLGDSRTPLYAMTAAALCNIALDILFVAAFHWGVSGVAIATVISQGVSCLICLIALRKITFLRLSRADLRPDTRSMGTLLRLGLPVAFQNGIIAMGGLVLQGVVNGFGFIFMAGFNASSRLTGLVELAGSSLGSAMGTFAGQNLGAGGWTGYSWAEARVADCRRHGADSGRLHAAVGQGAAVTVHQRSAGTGGSGADGCLPLPGGHEPGTVYALSAVCLPLHAAGVGRHHHSHGLRHCGAGHAYRLRTIAAAAHR